MEGEDKTEGQLVNELKELRKRINELEASEKEHKRMGEALRASEVNLSIIKSLNNHPASCSVAIKQGNIHKWGGLI